LKEIILGIAKNRFLGYNVYRRFAFMGVNNEKEQMVYFCCLDWLGAFDRFFNGWL
jgi:hypothetical protein